MFSEEVETDYLKFTRAVWGSIYQISYSINDVFEQLCNEVFLISGLRYITKSKRVLFDGVKEGDEYTNLVLPPLGILCNQRKRYLFSIVLIGWVPEKNIHFLKKEFLDNIIRTVWWLDDLKITVYLDFIFVACDENDEPVEKAVLATVCSRWE